MDLAKIIIAGKTRNYTGLDAAEIVMARKLGGGGGAQIVPFATGTDEQIVAMIQAAHAGTIDLQTDGGWAVGDTRTINIAAFTAGGNVAVAQQDIDIVITSFDEYMSCGNVLQFDFKDELAQAVRVMTSFTNVGGYGASEMYSTTLPALVNALPEWLKNSLIEFSCLASAGGQLSAIETITGNKLALRSEIEVKSDASRSFSGEGSYIPYYTAETRVKKRGHNGTGTGWDAAWWLRSPEKNSSNYFVVCVNDGTNATGAQQNHGVAPFGCL